MPRDGDAFDLDALDDRPVGRLTDGVRALGHLAALGVAARQRPEPAHCDRQLVGLVVRVRVDRVSALRREGAVRGVGEAQRR